MNKTIAALFALNCLGFGVNLGVNVLANTPDDGNLPALWLGGFAWLIGLVAFVSSAKP